MAQLSVAQVNMIPCALSLLDTLWFSNIQLIKERWIPWRVIGETKAREYKTQGQETEKLVGDPGEPAASHGRGVCGSRLF